MSATIAARSIAALWAGIVLLSAAATRADTPGIKIGGLVTTPGVWTPARIGQDLKADLKEVSYDDKGTQHTVQAVPLVDLIQAAGPAANPRIKHHELQMVVVVQAFDGYAVDFSLGELLPDFGNDTVWLSITPESGPDVEGSGLALIIPQDRKHARWVRGITALTIVDTTSVPLTKP